MHLLLLILLILLFISWLNNNHDIFSPSFIFCSSFIFSSVWAILYQEKWSFDPDYKTILVVSMGVLFFVIFSSLIHYCMRDNLKSHIKEDLIKIEQWKYILFILFEIFTIILLAKSVMNATQIHGFSNLSQAIFTYRHNSLNGTLLRTIPGFVNTLRICVSSSGYWFAYFFSLKLVNKKIPVYETIIILLAMVNSSLLGGRNGIINMIISIIVCYYFIYSRKNNFRLKFKFFQILKIILLFFLILYLFQFVGNILGRNINADVSIIDYLAKYCGAPLKNLDIFITSNRIGDIHGNNQTFIYLVQWIGSKIGMYTDYVLDLPFQSINNFNLGNVYTTFYPYLYDYGYFGEFFLVGFMAIICQFFYESCKKKNNPNKLIFFTVMYAYLFNALVFSFFSNKFYEQYFSLSFLKTLIFWELFDLFFLRIKYKTNKIKINFNGKLR